MSLEVSSDKHIDSPETDPWLIIYFLHINANRVCENLFIPKQGMVNVRSANSPENENRSFKDRGSRCRWWECSSGVTRVNGAKGCFCGNYIM